MIIDTLRFFNGTAIFCDKIGIIISHTFKSDTMNVLPNLPPYTKEGRGQGSGKETHWWNARGRIASVSHMSEKSGKG